MNFVPSEIEFIGAYWPPILFSATLGAVATIVTLRLLLRFRPERFVVLPEVVMLAITCIYTVLFGTFLFPL